MKHRWTTIAMLALTLACGAVVVVWSLHQVRGMRVGAAADPIAATAKVVPMLPPSAGRQAIRQHRATADVAGVSLPLISLNAPAYAASSSYPAAGAASYSSISPWRSSGPMPAWLAYDLSRVPVAQRQSNLVVWYNPSYEYDYGMDPAASSYNMPQTYTLETNAAPGGDPPSTGWTTVATVTGNLYHSRQHLINLNGANWLRLSISEVRGSAQNEDAALKLDVYDASAGAQDDFIFYGDSITANAMNPATAAGGAGDWLGALVHAQAPAHHPVAEAGGVPYLTTKDGAEHLGTWLGLFPGHFVGLSYGTNDANDCETPDVVYHNLVTMVQAVQAAGKVPLIPHIPYGTTPNIRACGPAVDAQIDAIYRAYPQVIPGPDLWSYFAAHPDLISSDGIHPTDAGDAALRQQWADLIVQRIYGEVPSGSTAAAAVAPVTPVSPVATPSRTPVGRRRSPQPAHAGRQDAGPKPRAVMSP